MWLLNLEGVSFSGIYCLGIFYLQPSMQGRVDDHLFVSLSGPLMAAGNPILFLLQVPVNAMERAFRTWCSLIYSKISCSSFVHTCAFCNNKVLIGCELWGC